MNERFGPSALRLYALAVRLLGWRAPDFWAATPAELTSALSPPDNHATPLGRGELNRMMEQDHGNPR